MDWIHIFKAIMCICFYQLLSFDNIDAAIPRVSPMTNAEN